MQAVLDALGFPNQVVELPQSTRSSAEAIGDTVAQVTKSLVFREQPTGKPILVIASGITLVNEPRIVGDSFGTHRAGRYGACP